jgi:putative acetyltransferase
MLFISPNEQGHGIGSALCQYAIQQLGVTQVDVNEQNPRAREFYEKMGFSIVNRSELDGQGKPYPISHMEVKA